MLKLKYIILKNIKILIVGEVITWLRLPVCSLLLPKRNKAALETSASDGNTDYPASPECDRPTGDDSLQPVGRALEEGPGWSLSIKTTMQLVMNPNFGDLVCGIVAAERKKQAAGYCCQPIASSQSLLQTSKKLKYLQSASSRNTRMTFEILS